MTLPLRFRRRLALVVLAALLVAGRDVAGADVASGVAVKAAMLYNFAKFVEWPALPPGLPIVACVVGDEAIAGALVDTARGQRIGGRALDVVRPRESAAWKGCHVLFIAGAETPKFGGELDGLRTLPVLTVSDGKGFARGGGIVELYVDSGRMRFAINVTSAERARLNLSSRLLNLAQIVKEQHDVQP